MDSLIGSPAVNSPKRLILFAAYYGDNVISREDLHTIKELSKWGEVNFMADCDLPSSEIDRIFTYTSNALARRHGEYDFGSWKYLIQHLGWDAIDSYDEVVFINNSIYLVGDLSKIFHFSTNSHAEFISTLFIDEHYSGKRTLLHNYLTQRDPLSESGMFCSYFWLMRRSLLRKCFVRNFFEAISTEETRIDVAIKYERGFTRSLIRHGCTFDIFIDRIYRYSSAYTADAFWHIKLGLPFLKKKVLSQTYYPIEGLSERILSIRSYCTKAGWDLLASDAEDRGLKLFRRDQ